MDIYKQYINRNADDKTTVNVTYLGRCLMIVMAPLLGGIDQAFQFIQEYTGVVSPGILAVLYWGCFGKQPNKAAIWEHYSTYCYVL
jgi:SSS family solute:Na+ symporter